MSRRSSVASDGTCGVSVGPSGQGASPSRHSISRPSVATGRTCRPRRAASPAFSGATTIAWSPTESVMGSAPRTGRIDPSRPSSPRKARPSIAWDSIRPSATRMPTAMARSSPAPVFFTSDGARFTVIFLLGQSSPLEISAARTRSRASRHATSGWPTMTKPGRPPAAWTSTCT